MKSLCRVVWSEGMHLSQHHFQAQNRYVEDSASFALSRVFFKPYGLIACQLDDEGIRNGTVTLVHARGVSPDGLAFHFPDDAAPEPVDVAARFSPTADRQRLLLAIPAYRPGRSNCELEESESPDGARFSRARTEIADETTGGDAKPVDVARKNFRLVLEGEVDETDEDLVTLPLARIRRDGAGSFVYDDAYIPPCLQIGGSPALVALLQRLVDVLDQKADALARERDAGAGSFSDYASQEVASFWMSHAIHSALTPLRHQLASRTVHPERLYTELGRLAGALCTFAMGAHPRDLPPYDHDDPEGCFTTLDRQIRDGLETFRPTNCITVKLTPADPFSLDAENAQGMAGAAFHAGTVSDERCFGDAHWFLGVRSTGRMADVVSGVPRLVKVCSAEDIVKLVRRALPGPALEHVASPPSAIAPRIGMEYFRLERSGPAWEVVARRRSVGVYVPDGIPGAEVELSVVLGSR